MRGKRWQCQLPTRIEWDNNRSGSAIAIDLSAGGTMLELSGIEQPMPNTRVALTFAPGVLRMNGKDVRLNGSIAWLDDAGLKTRAGVRFDSPPENITELLGISPRHAVHHELAAVMPPV